MKHKVLAAQNVSRMCLVCGTRNAAGLKARFYELEGGELLGVFRPLEEHRGNRGACTAAWRRRSWTRP